MVELVEAAELVEIFQWMTPEASTRVADDPAVQQHLGEEIADVLVYLVQIADRCGVDVAITCMQGDTAIAQVAEEIGERPHMKHMGQVMKVATAIAGAKADGARLSAAVRDRL